MSDDTPATLEQRVANLELAQRRNIKGSEGISAAVVNRSFDLMARSLREFTEAEQAKRL